jgi:aspartate carbamoyltransferase catalytic subunit
VPRVGEERHDTASHQETRELLRTKGKRDAITLHSLSRIDELTPDVEETRNARCWQEAFCGVVVRMALPVIVLGAIE